MLRGLFAIPALLLCLAALPAAGWAQQSGEEAKKPEKKKARKIWTNDDFPSRPRPTAKPEVKPEVKLEVADPWAELDKAREDLALEQENLEYYRRDLDRYTEDRSREFDPARREALDLANSSPGRGHRGFRGQDAGAGGQNRRAGEADQRPPASHPAARKEIGETHHSPPDASS